MLNSPTNCTLCSLMQDANTRCLLSEYAFDDIITTTLYWSWYHYYNTERIKYSIFFNLERIVMTDFIIALSDIGGLKNILPKNNRTWRLMNNKKKYENIRAFWLKLHKGWKISVENNKLTCHFKRKFKAHIYG